MCLGIGYKSRLMDWDNFAASFKHLGDALVSTGVILDDKPAIVVRFETVQIKVPRKFQRVVIEITDYKINTPPEKIFCNSCFYNSADLQRVSEND